MERKRSNRRHQGGGRGRHHNHHHHHHQQQQQQQQQHYQDHQSQFQSSGGWVRRGGRGGGGDSHGGGYVYYSAPTTPRSMGFQEQSLTPSNQPPLPNSTSSSPRRIFSEYSGQVQEVPQQFYSPQTLVPTHTTYGSSNMPNDEFCLVYQEPFVLPSSQEVHIPSTTHSETSANLTHPQQHQQQFHSQSDPSTRNLREASKTYSPFVPSTSSPQSGGEFDPSLIPLFGDLNIETGKETDIQISFGSILGDEDDLKKSSAQVNTQPRSGNSSTCSTPPISPPYTASGRSSLLSSDQNSPTAILGEFLFDEDIPLVDTEEE